MSVINNVLKDLQSRPSQFVPIEIASVESAVNNQAKASKVPIIALLLGLLMAALAYWVLQNHQDSVGVASQVKAIVDIPAAPVPIVSEVIEPVIPLNQIIDLQISESADDMRLEFSLQAKVTSYLKERGENSFVYFLKDIRSEIVAPVINHNRWIEQLSINALDKGVEISFRTVPGVLVETRQQPGDSGQAWIIKLKKTSPPIAQPIVPAIVKPAIAEIAADAKTEADSKVAVIEESKVVKLDITSRPPGLTDSEKLAKAIGLQKNRRWQQAEAMLVSLIDGSEDLVARQNLLFLYEYRLREGNYTTLLQESLARYPQESVFKTEFARSLYKTGDYAELIEYLQDTGNSNATQLALIGASYQRLDQHAKAVELYQRSLEKDGRQVKNWIALGISQEHTTQLKDALRSYRIASRLGNVNARLEEFVKTRISQLVKVIN